MPWNQAAFDRAQYHYDNMEPEDSDEAEMAVRLEEDAEFDQAVEQAEKALDKEMESHEPGTTASPQEV